MKYKDFYTCYGEALAESDRDTFVSDWSLSSIFPEDSDLLENAELAGNIWDIAHMTIKDLCQQTGISQAAIGYRFCVPYRTVQQWYAGDRSCPEYVKIAMADSLGLLKVPRE